MGFSHFDESKEIEMRLDDVKLRETGDDEITLLNRTVEHTKEEQVSRFLNDDLGQFGLMNFNKPQIYL